jgi:protein tyrosine phosphatase (PTP) superfamily phosphohydrolase (DUF442 family)
MWRALFCLPLLVHAAFGATPAIIHSDWGDVEEVRQIDHFYVSAAPDEGELVKFHDAGGAVVIDLRTPKEMNCGTRSQAAKLGLSFHSIPFDSKDALSPKLLSQFATAMAEAHGKPVLVTCQTGNRAALLLTAHLVASGQLAPAAAPLEAKSFGLRSDALKKKLAAYLAAR